MEQGELSYIVVEGPIGVGKTTLARRLAEGYGGGTPPPAPPGDPRPQGVSRTPRPTCQVVPGR